MKDRSGWLLRRFDAPFAAPRTADFWRTRPYAERMRAILALHVEGNALFRGGHRRMERTLVVRHG
ncbi:hypothetical protein SD81_016165 [Tolypothrix campylonemoides VB511288]|nr:hypothetical protein SD81_016165 [Tolypothrix campylonemoides VB511288]